MKKIIALAINPKKINTPAYAAPACVEEGSNVLLSCQKTKTKEYPNIGESTPITIPDNHKAILPVL